MISSTPVTSRCAPALPLIFLTGSRRARRCPARQLGTRLPAIAGRALARSQRHGQHPPATDQTGWEQERLELEDFRDQLAAAFDIQANELPAAYQTSTVLRGEIDEQKA